MSRLPPMLEQLINGKIVKGANLLPVESNGIVYSIYIKTIPNEQGRLYNFELRNPPISNFLTQTKYTSVF